MSSEVSKKTVITCGGCGEKGHNRMSKACLKNPKVDRSKANVTEILMKKDKSADELNYLRKYFTAVVEADKAARERQVKIGEEFGKTPRSHGLSQEASQGIVMSTYHYQLNDMTCRQPKSGDLISDIDGKVECKAITCTNDAPGSCGSTQGWETMILLDATGFLEDRYRVMRLCIPDTDKRWDEFKRAKKNKDNKLVRPRLNWKKILAKFGDEFKVIYEGSFEGIFVKGEPTLGTP